MAMERGASRHPVSGMTLNPAVFNFGRAFQLWLVSGLVLIAAVIVPLAAARSLLFGAAAGIFLLTVLRGGAALFSAIRRRRDISLTIQSVHSADYLTLVSDRNGKIVYRSDGTGGESTVAQLLSREVAEPEIEVWRLVKQLSDRPAAELALAGRKRIRVRAGAGSALVWEILSETSSLPDANLPAFRVSDSGDILDQNRLAEELFGTLPARLSDRIDGAPLGHLASHDIQTKTGKRQATTILVNAEEGQEVILVPDAPVRAFDDGEALPQPPSDLLGSLPVPMMKIAADGAVIEANTEARSIFGMSAGDTLPPLFELVEGMGRPIADWLSDAADGRGLLKPEIVRAVVPGQELFLQIALGRMLENDKMVLIGILNDATELKTLEAQFVQRQKMQAIGQLAGGVAHDFNNLLTAISGHCDLLLLRHDAGDPEYSDLIQISQNANRAASLVGQLLAFSRKQNLKPQAIDIRDTMSDLAHLLNRLIGERIQLVVTHAPGPQMIRADRRQLEQVIVNLVVNARDAMPEGGQIKVSSRVEYLEEETLRDRARLTPGSYVVIDVIDNGVGISPEGLTKIFEPFYTTKKTGEGTGLGLSTAYGIVKQTGGYDTMQISVVPSSSRRRGNRDSNQNDANA